MCSSTSGRGTGGCCRRGPSIIALDLAPSRVLGHLADATFPRLDPALDPRKPLLDLRKPAVELVRDLIRMSHRPSLHLLV